MYKTGLLALTWLAFVPHIALAQDAAERAAAQAAGFVATFNSVILFPTIALLSAVALLVFIFGCMEYIAMAGNDTARQKGIKHITWGIIGLVVMLSAYTILSIITGTFGLQDELDGARRGEAVVPIPDADDGRITPDPDADD